MSNKRIMVVEDEWIVADDIQKSLRKLEYTVSSVVSTGEGAVQKAEEDKPDLVLMDIMLQGEMDGIEAARQIRTRFNIPVIYLTAFADKEILERAKITEPYGYMIKPFKDNVLHSNIEMAIFKHKMENRLRESEERYRRLVETAQDAIICIDEDGIINIWNKFAEKIFGYSKEEIIGQPVAAIIPERYKKKHQKGLEQFLQTGKTKIINKTVEFAGKQKEGIEIPIEISLSYRKIEEKRYSFTAIIRDITEKKRLEEERKCLINELEFKNKELKHILYVTSHDLRSPLVNIAGYSKELEYAFEEVRTLVSQIDNLPHEVKEKLDYIIDKDASEFVKYILASVTKVDSLLDGMLRLSRISRTSLEIKQLDMNKLISEIANVFDHKIKEMGVALHIGELPLCNGDEMQINQVFSNLMSNALKYLDPNRPGNIRISGKKEAAMIIYCIEDNGIGIAAKDQDKIYEIFQRLNPENTDGEGLGLTIVRSILDRHGGNVYVESEPDKGSKFFVSLPG